MGVTIRQNRECYGFFCGWGSGGGGAVRSDGRVVGFTVTEAAIGAGWDATGFLRGGFDILAAGAFEAAAFSSVCAAVRAESGRCAATLAFAGATDLSVAGVAGR